MKTGIREALALVFESDEMDELERCRTTIRYTNKGEPFREFVEIEQERGFDGLVLYSHLDRREVTKLRDKLNEFLGEKA